MTNTQLEAFLTLCRYGSVSRAAEHLYITQPAVSRLIKTLETELGYTLFRRGKGMRQIVLTPNGEHFYYIATDIDRLYQQALEPATSEVRKIFRLGATPSLFSSFLPDAYMLFRRENPQVDVVLDALHSMEAYQQLLRGELDLALINAHIVDAAVTSVPLFSEKVVLLCSRNLLPDGPVHPSQLERTQAVSTEWSPEFQAWFEYWFGKALSSTYLRIKTGSYIEYFHKLHEFWAIVPETSAVHIRKNTLLDIHEIIDAPPDRICYALYKHTSDTQPREQMLTAIQNTLLYTPHIKLL